MPSHMRLVEGSENGGDLEDHAREPPSRPWSSRIALGLIAGLVLLAVAGAALFVSGALAPPAPSPQAEDAPNGTASNASTSNSTLSPAQARRAKRFEELRRLCPDCTPAWDEEDVSRICEGREGAVMRRRLASDNVDMAMRYRMKYHSGHFMYFGSQDLNDDRIAAESITVIVHGAGRNSQDYFCTLRKLDEEEPVDFSVFDAASLILAPKFSEKKDQYDNMDCVWNGSSPNGDWRVGAETDDSSPCKISSFELFDALIRLANNRTKFPLVKLVRFLGFSAGGQTVHRYSLVSHLPPPQLSSKAMAAAGTGPDPDMTVNFIIGNPSSYTYLDKHRWAYTCRAFDDDNTSKDDSVQYSKAGQRLLPDDAGCFNFTYTEYKPNMGRQGWAKGGQKFKNLKPPSDDRPFICEDSSFNDWGYGLSTDAETTPDGFVPFLKGHPDLRAGIREWFPHREVTFLIGDADTCTADTFQFCFSGCWRRDDVTSPCHPTLLDVKCPAMLQGPNRKQRAIHYHKHLQNFYGKKVHKLFLVPGVGHQSEEEFLAAMFEYANKSLQEIE